MTLSPFFCRRFLGSQSGSVSILAAVSIVPLILVIALLVDTGFAWLSRDKAFAGAQAAAAVAAMQRPACTSGQELTDAGYLENVTAAFEMNSGLMAEPLVVSCTDTGVAVEVRVVSETSMFRALIGADVAITARAEAKQVPYGTNVASGWSR